MRREGAGGGSGKRSLNGRESSIVKKAESTRRGKMGGKEERERETRSGLSRRQIKDKKHVSVSHSLGNFRASQLLSCSAALSL